MSKSQLTRAELAAALQRILSGEPLRVSPDRKLSIKAVEEEAGLGNGSAYYYPDIVQDIKQAATPPRQGTTTDDVDTERLFSLRLKLKNETRLKDQYRAELADMKTRFTLMASQHNQLSIVIQQYKDKVLAFEAKAMIHAPVGAHKK